MLLNILNSKMIKWSLSYVCLIFIIIVLRSWSNNGLSPEIDVAKNVLKETPLSCDIRILAEINSKLLPTLKKLLSNDVLKYYKVNLYKDCKFWGDDGLCVNESCNVEISGEEEVPVQWRAAALGAVHFSTTDLLLSPVKCKDEDFSVLDDDNAHGGVFVNLESNPERFTGYSGDSAQRIWRAIYEENCFQLPQRAPLGFTDTCMEHMLYYKVISGLHASISTHLCFDNLNRTSGIWGPNLRCYQFRVGNFPERVENIHYVYLILLRAIEKVSSYLPHRELCGCEDSDHDVKVMIEKVAGVLKDHSIVFDERTFFTGENQQYLKTEIKEKFRNVTRIMDCVGCQKCRLWGKLQTTGLGTALKILFSYDDKSFRPDVSFKKPLFQRSEIVALFNTLGKFASSIEAIQTFNWMQRNDLKHPEKGFHQHTEL